MTKTLDPVDVYREVAAKRAALADSLPALRDASAAGMRSRGIAAENVSRVRGDSRIGRATVADLNDAEAAYEKAIAEDERTSAAVRAAEEDLAALDREVARTEHEARAWRQQCLTERHRQLVAQLRKHLDAAAESSAALFANHREAMTAFPESDGTFGRAAGLPDLAWGELMHVPEAHLGGRLGSWRVAADAFMKGER